MDIHPSLPLLQRLVHIPARRTNKPHQHGISGLAITGTLRASFPVDVMLQSGKGNLLVCTRRHGCLLVRYLLSGEFACFLSCGGVILAPVFQFCE